LSFHFSVNLNQSQIAKDVADLKPFFKLPEEVQKLVRRNNPDPVEVVNVAGFGSWGKDYGLFQKCFNEGSLGFDHMKMPPLSMK
jgi:hypothetical protein